jgi:hypothetical protein
MKKLFLAAIVLTTASAKLNAQAIASATATATIVSPINIAKVADLNFGNLAVTASVGGVVTLEPSAAATRTTSGGGVTFPATMGTVTAGRFTVSGQPNYTYDVLLPSDALLEGPGSSMLSTAYTCNLPGNIGTLDGTGLQTLYVGADLFVAPAQAPGVYTTTLPFEVVVNYN